MEPFDIPLLPKGEEGSGYRTTNEQGKTARNTLIDGGGLIDGLVLRAKLVEVTHGQFWPGGDLATLLVFEFDFIGMKGRRFVAGEITITFEDVDRDPERRVQIHKIAPKGTYRINKTATEKTIKHAAHGTLKGEYMGGGGETGYAWEMEQTKSTPHWVNFTGMLRCFSGNGRDDTAIWRFEEDNRAERKEGIPSFLRAAVMLRRSEDAPFRFTIKAQTEVDFKSRIETFFGRKTPEPIDPVDLDNSTDIDELGIDSLDPQSANLDKMKTLDIDAHGRVVIASLMQAEG
ncbi:hypothetical protein F4779DRAFT_34441 [Xylariaceae sp. FL0662B]|nr:hypothetical protein F4779DRAFT_34441 [Xylariaceae sp. FL0662B]